MLNICKYIIPNEHNFFELFEFNCLQSVGGVPGFLLELVQRHVAMENVDTNA